MTIYLIRHTEVAVERGVAYGQTDVPLADTYDEQRDHLLRHLPENPAVVFSSPLSRCRQLAEDLAKTLMGSQIEVAPGQTRLVDKPGMESTGESTPGVDSPSVVRYDDRLKEYFFGDWEMKPWDAMDRAQLDSWMADFVSVAAPNGENFTDLAGRVRAFWEEQVLPLEKTHTGQSVLVVAHGGVIRALLAILLELPLANAYRLNLDYGAVTKLTLADGNCTVQYINR
ncbi:alpha-ribazole phosphatase family protein [Spirosoma sp. KUDC1026]|uniref:alpha-ribazole phosphatase family protein n=1 Tax=Spirosoma sp. KUDC1026 TaxID=2745947 RepID=UPI00159BA2CD|nr:alpha-ribazole phosphatase family protein [Spirosoma sp. KUDC1026]QKZ13975.1 alpha-ribazole phosphatase family protein [Spirosoma sp. KUDC1026]